MEREKPNRRAGGERGGKRCPRPLRRCGAAHTSPCTDIPDLFPEPGFNCGSRCAQPSGWLAPRSPAARLPSYGEACRQPPRATGTAPHACMNSYPNLHPGHRSRGSPPPHQHPRVPVGCGRGSGRWDGGCRDCGRRGGEPALLRAAGTERRDPLCRGVMSPCAGGSWRRISSLESEV